VTVEKQSDTAAAVTQPTLSITQDDNNDIHLTVIFQVNLGNPVPECLHSGFCWSYRGGEW